MKTEKRFCHQCGGNKDYQILEADERAVLWGSSHAELRGSSHAVLRGSSHAVAAKYCSVTLFGEKVKCRGGVQIQIPEILTANEWCDFYGVEIKRGVAILFKGVNDNFESPHGISYVPGTIPSAPDWDGGKKECGGGLHFSPSPAHTLEFNHNATKFIACPVRVKDIVVHKNAQYPNKIKAKSCCAPVWEVDRYGNKIGGK